MEHAALLHGCEPPAWGEERERFLPEPVALLDQWCSTTVCHLPAPFSRRGIVLDPRNLDRRTGDEQWSPEPGDPDDRWPRSDWFNGEVERRARLLYVQKPPTRPEPGRSVLRNACAHVETAAASIGWVVRVSLSGLASPATYVLRGPHRPNARIVAMESADARAFISQALEPAGLDERRWHELLADVAKAPDDRVCPPRTVWSRPGLTIAGSAAGIMRRWQCAHRTMTQI